MRGHVLDPDGVVLSRRSFFDALSLAPLGEIERGLEEFRRQLELATIGGVTVLGDGGQLNHLRANLFCGFDQSCSAGMQVIILLGQLKRAICRLGLAGLLNETVADFAECGLVPGRDAGHLDHGPRQGALDRPGHFAGLEAEGCVSDLRVSDSGLRRVSQFLWSSDFQDLGDVRRRLTAADTLRRFVCLSGVLQHELRDRSKFRLGERILLEIVPLLEIRIARVDRGRDLRSGKPDEGDRPGFRLH